MILIDKEAFIKEFDNRCRGECCCCLEVTTSISGCKVIDEAPVIDAVPVVRCKDCLWGKEVSGNIECLVNDYAEPMYHGYYWYCANGERKTDE